MNNYCTNCGKKLKKDELVCKNCHTAIIDLPYNSDYKSIKKNKRTKNILIAISIFILCISVIRFAKLIIYKIKINELQKKYVEPYLKQNYSDTNYSIKYNTSGECIISGNCDFDPVMGCDGGSCQPYKYLDKSECESHYYKVKIDTKELIITVVNKDKTYSVVEGKNIYGTDKQDK